MAFLLAPRVRHANPGSPRSGRAPALPFAGAHKRRGATTVEFAVICSVLFLVVLGFIEVTRGFMVIHLLNSAARQGCRIGVIEGKSTKDIRTAAVKTLKSQGIHGEVTTVMVNGGAADASTSKAGDEITVTISVPASSVSWVPGARFLVGNISSQYTLRRE